MGVTPAALRLDGTVTVVRPAARGAHLVRGGVRVGVRVRVRLGGTVTVVRPAALGAHLGRRGETNQVLTAAECVSAMATVPTTLFLLHCLLLHGLLHGLLHC